MKNPKACVVFCLKQHEAEINDFTKILPIENRKPEDSELVYSLHA